MKPYYDDGQITIYHGDCREILPTLGPVDLVLTDPPYGVVHRESHAGQLRNLDKAKVDTVNFDIPDIAQSLTNICNGSFYVWCGTEQVSFWRMAFVEAGLSTRLCIWEKANPSPMNGEYIWLSGLETCVFAKASGATFNVFCESPIWRSQPGRETDHPTEKPRWLMKKLVLASSNMGDIVLDPFMGSGTTLRAAKDLGRRAIGIEIEEKYCEVAVKRLAQEVLPLGFT